MAISITYGELKAQVLSIITNRCQNVDTWDARPFAPAMPASLKNGWNRTVGKGSGVQYCYGRVTLSDTTTDVVTTATISADFENFMASCGINGKSSSVISYRGMINFLSCAYRYISKRVVLVHNEDTAEWAIVWNNTGDFIYPTQVAETNIATATDIVQLIDALTASYAAANSRKKSLNLTYNYACSSSSSSSSSSSNCSSSMFIAYMNLDI